MADFADAEDVSAYVNGRADEALRGLDLLYHQLVDEFRSGTIDRQALAYRGMASGDAVPDDQIVNYVGRAHAPLDPAVHPDHQILGPADYERMNWDAERVDPRPDPA